MDFGRVSLSAEFIHQAREEVFSWNDTLEVREPSNRCIKIELKLAAEFPHRCIRFECGMPQRYGSAQAAERPARRGQAQRKSDVNAQYS